MYNNNNKENNENFWISYADLMAGLLFVFILVIGAIIIKYLYTQTDLLAIKVDLEKEKKALNLSEEELKNRKNQLEEINKKLHATLEENTRLAFELASSKRLYEQSKLNEQDLQFSLNNALKSVSLSNEELEKLKALLLDYELKIKDETSKKEQLLVQLEDKNNFIKLKDNQLALLQEKLLEQSLIHQKLVEEFDITKTKIKHLTGIKLTVIAKLKEKLGSSIDIDTKSGAIKFSSNILFDQNQYKLKDEYKEDLKNILKNYLSILFDEEIKDFIHSVIIEGHTNSDGTYLSNLELSQQRALELMKFLYESNIINKELLAKYVSASGRSYSDLILKNGIEDKDASRRIEIKFIIKNENAITELQNFLEKK